MGASFCVSLGLPGRKGLPLMPVLQHILLTIPRLPDRYTERFLQIRPADDGLHRLSFRQILPILNRRRTGGVS